MAELSGDVLGADQGGSICPDLGEDLRGGGSGGHALRVVDVGYDTAHREGFGKIPQQGGPQDDGETTSERTGKWMGVSLAGGNNSGGGIIGIGDLKLLPPEHSHLVHGDQAHYGHVSGGGAEAGIKVGQAMVLAGRLGLGGDADGVLGGGTDGGGV